MSDTPVRRRSAGLLAPLFCLRRAGDAGIGDVAALRELIAWAAEFGFGFIQLLPLNETGPDRSPYNAISAVALEPLTLEVSPATFPELTAADMAAAREKAGAAALDGPRVDYEAVASYKYPLLRTAFARSAGAGGLDSPDFAAFRAKEAAWLPDHALFCVLRDEAGGSICWDQWPAEFNTPEQARAHFAKCLQVDDEAASRKFAFYEWLQWRCFTQWREVRAAADAAGVRLMGDVPIGVSYYSSDVFFNPRLFRSGWSGGSPPETAFKDDAFTCKWGQNWGIPLYDWAAHESEGYAWWRRRVGRLCEVFEMFRVDHILGFYRLYGFPWRPERNGEFLPLTPDEAAARTGGPLPRFHEHDDDTPEHKQANLAQGDHLLRMVQAAAGTAEVIGEDLGTVPDYVRPHLLSLGIPGFKIPQWEEHPDGAAFPECSFATYATHDLPPLRVIWESLLQRLQSADEGERWAAGVELGRLAQFAGLSWQGEPPLWSSALQWQLLGGLFRAASRHVALGLTDLFGMTDRFNVPGTSGEGNWRARMPFTMAEMSTGTWREAAETCRGLIATAGRAPGH